MSVSEQRNTELEGSLDLESAETVRLSVEQATAIGARALRALRYSDDEITIILQNRESKISAITKWKTSSPSESFGVFQHENV